MTSEAAFQPPRWDMETDVVVVGYGGAGAVTAISARDQGAEVVVIEKMPADLTDRHGNAVELRHTPNSRISAGIILTPTSAEDGYSYQRAMSGAYGTDDVPDDMLWAWAEMAAGNHEWLRALKGGEVFDWAPETGPGGLGGAQYPEFPGAASTRRLQNPGGGVGFFACLDENVREMGAEVLYATPAKELVQHPATKEILGVRAEQGARRIAIRARRAVVLACGGFEFNPAMHATYLRIWPCKFYGNPANTGDGIPMAQKAGADLWHMNNISGMAVAWWPDSQYAFWCTPWLRQAFGAKRFADGTPIEEYPPSYSVIIVDRYGKRFAQEIYKPYSFYWEMSRFDTEKAEFPRIPSHMIFDEKTRREGPIANPSGPYGPMKLYEWSPDNSVEVAKGWIRKADTIRELSEVIGVPAGNLEETVAGWNRYCREGVDPECGRDPSTLTPIDTPPFYEIIQWPGSGNTLGGPKRDKDARIVDPDGRPIPRLYSAGELGSIYGFLYQGGANLAECIAFGRIAGERAAAERPW